MFELNEIFIAVVLICTIFMCGIKRFKLFIIMFIFQSLAMALIFLEEAILSGEAHYYLLFGLTLAIKVILIPIIIKKSIQHLKINRELEFHIDLYWTYIFAIIGFVLVYTIFENNENNNFKVGIFVMIVGGLLMMARKKAITQMIGFLVIENGLLLFETSITTIPMLLATGIIFEVLILALILGILVFHINKTFDNIELESLTLLKEEFDDDRKVSDGKLLELAEPIKGGK